METQILIVGAGPTGLGAAWRLDARGHRDWMLVEAEPVCGGLARSVRDEHGFTWDLGGHVQFSHYEMFDAVMDDLLGPEGWLYHDRESWVWVRGRFVPYPFQSNVHRLPEADCAACLRGLEAVAGGPRAAIADFGAWIDASFGAGISEVFMRPYNVKVWAGPLERMACRWVGDRVATVDLDRLSMNARLNRDDVSWGPNNQFRFPARGGTGAVWQQLGRRLMAAHPGRLRLRMPLVHVDLHDHVARFADGSFIIYERLLSTLPLDRLVAISHGAAAVSHAAADLEHTSTHVIGVALHGRAGRRLAGKCWMYFPEPDCPFYRVTHFSHYSPSNVPDAGRYWSLMAEVSESPFRPVDASRVVDETLDGLVATGLITRRADVHHTWHVRLEHGYPVPTLRRDRALATLLPFFEAHDVFSRGRFGAWMYEVANQDHCFAQGVELVECWMTGAEETTLRQPEIVNARRPPRPVRPRPERVS